MPFFDAAAGAPLHPAGRAALLAALDDGWADPAKLYGPGRTARLLLDASREAAAEVLGVRPDEVRFTPSGGAAVHWGIQGGLDARKRTGRQLPGLAVSAVEHSSVLHTAHAHEADGGPLATVPVDGLGRVDLDAWRAAVSVGGTALACLQSANHEVGTVQPVAEAAEACAAAGVPLLVDAAQSAGRTAVPEGWSLLAASARKWGGPAGVGLLVVRRRVRFREALPGWQRGDVPGGLNLPAVVAAVAALRAVHEEAAEEDVRLSALVDRIRTRVPKLLPDARLLGDPRDRLPHLVTFSVPYVDGEVLLNALDRAGYAVSSGSSCTSDTLTPSHVLAAMGAFTGGNVRVSLPRGTTSEEVDGFLAVLPGAVASARAEGGSATASPSEGGRLTLNTLGLRCPIPVTELARHIGDVPVGGVVAVQTDDDVAAIDIPAWAHTAGHLYLGQEDGPGTAVTHLVRRG
ncbi:cysteine desulfurase [Mangrovactinospora gilvigrisea]|uniref:Cysteine desulfurase n=1 Tax=Mangrovactinospora gilvigrisea TaxID=1428644 RepID=A0A1J7C7N7_9ACTN|nr:cysteine desulfurase/sulfurtransferase TusA family protein [Mangrovactinospora gilvigrisea]OIV37552.1 cysteine desulfurase [Mangrovactinospora gilvigrisea]